MKFPCRVFVLFLILKQFNSNGSSEYLDKSYLKEDVHEEIPNISQWTYVDLTQTPVFNTGMQMQADVSCSPLENGYKLQVKGEYLIVHEILEGNHCPGKVRVIELFAIDKIIIDQDFAKVAKEMQVSVIAPIWELVFDLTRNVLSPPSYNYHGDNGQLWLPGETGNLHKIERRYVSGWNLRVGTNSESVKRYKIFILSSISRKNLFSCSIIYTQLSSDTKILNDYKIIYFIDELIAVEKSYSTDSNINSAKFILWKQGIHEYSIHQKQSEKSVEHTKVLLILDNIVSRKIQKLEQNFYDNSILMIETYLDACIVESQRLRDAEIADDMKSISDKFKVEFEREIKEAKQLIQDELQVYLQTKIDELNSEIKQLIEEFDDLIESKEHEIEELKNKREELQAKIKLRVLFGFFQLLFLGLTFINPACAIVAVTLSTATSMVESKILDSNDIPTFAESVEESKNLIDTMDYNLNKFKEDNIDMDTADTTEGIIGKGLQTVDKISEALSETKQVDNMINEASDNIRKFQDFKQMVYEHMEPQVEEIQRKIVMKSNGFASSSLTYLEFQKWHMDDYLMDVSTQLETWTEKFKVQDSVKVTMRKLTKAMKANIRLHTLMKEFQTKIKNAQYTEDISSAQFQITNIHDEELKQPLTTLMHTHYANDILDEYSKWIIAFKQYTFPFAKEFPDISVSLIPRFTDPVFIANLVVEKMKFIKSQLHKKKAEGQLFTDTTRAKFGNGGPLPPFYRWNRSIHAAYIIKDILEGKEVKLFANISKQMDFNALKFRDINILFASADPKISAEIKNDLANFSVTLTHNGDNYYRCDDKVHLIKSGAHKFGIRFFMSRRRRSVDYRDLDYVLSPFATWTIRLYNNLGSNNFTSLAKYVNKVNIELVGDGQFMYLNATVCKNDYREYYGKEILFNT